MTDIKILCNFHVIVAIQKQMLAVVVFCNLLSHEHEFKNFIAYK